MASPDNSNPDRLEALFDAALQISSPAERAAFLERECAGDLPLRQRLEALLRAAAKAGDFLGDKPIASSTIRLTVPITEKAGDKIGRYKLREKIGEGGCGVVYVAEQEAPVRRRVALKVIKLGMDTGSVVARFEAERQALAMMDHPNIAKVLDAGATDTGRPYFVMELVRGIKITEYCDQNNLSTRERLNLFTSVCNAVQHAHQKGIIHRDLKPSNILVTLHDGVPVPKVIDFGIAKATEGRLTDATVYTELHQFIGTPAYMSPEQAEMSGLDIDTRADIYSLGVLLYELLTGKPPFSAEELLRAGVDEMVRTIREKEPMRPSTRLSTMLEGERTALAKRHSADAFKLIAILRGDIDWIVMKCLEKDRTRRYETANGLAADLQRHLNNEPVIARPPSTLYRFQKMARRNKVAFAAATAVLTALVLGISVSAWQAIRAIKAEREQRHLAKVTEAARGAENLQRTAAETAQRNEVAHRQNAEQRLYDSLVREARATRMARRVGYRAKVFNLLQQANALDVLQRRDADLRREAVACLGDFVGLSPKDLSSTESIILFSRLAPTGRVGAFARADGVIVLCRLPSLEELGRLECGKELKNVVFSGNENQLMALAWPERDPLKATIFVATNAPNGWRISDAFSLPGAFELLGSATNQFIAVRQHRADPITLLDATTRRVVHRIALPPTGTWLPEIGLSPDGQRLLVASSSRSQTFEVWDLSKDEQLQSMELPITGRFPTFSFSPNGRRFSVATEGGMIVYATDDLKTTTQLHEFFGVRRRAAFAPISDVIALPLPQQQQFRLFDCLRNEDVALLDDQSGAEEAVFAPDESFLLTAGNFHARVYQLDMKKESLRLPKHLGGVPTVCFSPDGLRAATVSQDQFARVWDAFTGKIIWKSDKLSGGGQAGAFSPDGKLLVTTHWNSKSVTLWDARTGQNLLEFETNKPGSVYSAQFSPDGKFLVTADDSASRDGIAVWSVDSPSAGETETNLAVRLVATTPAIGRCRSVVFAPTGHVFAFVQWRTNSGVYLWNLDTTNAPHRVSRDVAVNVQSLTFSPDGRRLSFVSRNRSVTTLDVATEQVVENFSTLDSQNRLQRTPVENLSLSPDGRKFAMASVSSMGIDIWDRHGGKLLYSLPDQKGAVWWLAWSPDSKRLAVSRSNGDVSIWSLDEAERVLATLGLAP